ncbi:MAG TPA: TIGR01777 family oxidoreductase, partial [Acidimicrobiia bacterium]|nr:TIGR01777 family oxidoreductase [Acidimicrobiia bacterium]
GNQRWNEAHKARVKDSRVRGTSLLAQTLAKLNTPPRALVSGSAVGYYGDRGDEVLTESSRPGNDFLAEVCTAWEAATDPAKEAGIRVAHIWTGLVLSGRGGVLPKMLLPFRFGVGGKLGSGRQWMSWIALADEVGAIVHLLDDDTLSGPFNLTAPNPVTNADMTKAIGTVLHRPTVMPAPAFALKAALGAEMAEELLLVSQRVLPTRLLDSGFTFQYPELGEALQVALAESG